MLPKAYSKEEKAQSHCNFIPVFPRLILSQKDHNIDP